MKVSELFKRKENSIYIELEIYKKKAKATSTSAKKAAPEWN